MEISVPAAALIVACEFVLLKQAESVGHGRSDEESDRRRYDEQLDDLVGIHASDELKVD